MNRTGRHLAGWLIAVLLCATGASADDGDGPRHFLWEVAGTHNRVYLLGSVHMLRRSDYPLPAPMEAAYEEAEQLLMELDMDDLDPVAIQTLMVQKGRIADDKTLADLLGEKAWQSAAADAAAIGVDMTMLEAVEPWLAAMTVLNLQMAKQGFSPNDGVEMHFARRAAVDGKAITGLETAEFQFDLFDRLPLQLQADFLLKSLTDARTMADDADALVDAWKNADLDTMQREMTESFAEAPVLYDVLVAERNRRWLQQLLPLLDSDDDYLVVVGALHLVGDDGLVALLLSAGKTVRQH